MTTRRKFLSSAATILAGGAFALLFPISGRAARRFKKRNYIFIDMDIVRRDEFVLAKIPSIRALKAEGYAVAFIKNEHFGNEPFYPERQGVALHLAKIKRCNSAIHFSAFNHSVFHADDGGERQLKLDAENFILENKNKPFFLHWTHHPTLHSQEDVLKIRRKKGDFDISQNKVVNVDIKPSVNIAVNMIRKKLKELGIAGNTTLLYSQNNGRHDIA